MSVLYFLEKLRTPFLDAFFSGITHLGEETLFIILGLFFFWCVNKKEGYYLLFIGFIGTSVNQILKLLFRIPRPWVKNKDFTIVESARSGATGYSFPSGHTQSSVGVFGGLARWNRNKAIRIAGIVLCVLIPLSRLYLGVHTPLDVGVSVGVALLLVFGLYPLVQKGFENRRTMRILLGSTVGICLCGLLFAILYPFPEDVDAANLSFGIETAYKLLGAAVGIFISFEIDERYIHFETKGNFLCQTIKLVIGVALLLAFKQGLKAPLAALFGTAASGGVRYLLVLLFAGCVWPLFFRKIRSFSEKKKP